MRILLIGFMGSGKTSVAKLLADKLNLKSIEMDDLTLEMSGKKSINEIFSIDGEKRFRELELQVAKDLAGKDDVVISSGGGVIMDENTMNMLKYNSKTIYIKLTFENSAKRVALKKVLPPLFQDKVSAKKLFDMREPMYTSYADIVINTDDKSVSEVVNDIVVELK